MYNTRFIVLLILSSLVIWSCEDRSPDNFVLKGQIKGLKKGMVYLQKDGDSSLVNLDSMAIKGQDQFVLSTNLEEPILLYLSLAKKDGQDHFIPFFANKGETQITTTLDNFRYEADIKGSKQQTILEDYLKMMSSFNDANLDLIKESFEAQKANDSIKVDSLELRKDNLFKRKYAYTINFALNNYNSEVAPYLALYEIPNTSLKYVDSIYNKLTDSVKTSFYGRKLKDVLDQSKNPVE